MLSIRTTILFAVVTGFAGTPASGQVDARTILIRIDSLQALVVHESATIEMRLFDGDREVRQRTLDLKTQNEAGLRKALVVFTSPADIRGMSLLTIETAAETDQRLYLPALHRVQRITGSRRRERFAGSDFTFEDLRPRNPDQYESSILEKQPGVWVIAMAPSDEQSPYSRIEATVDSARLVVTRARYFDRSNRLKKILTSSGFSQSRPGVWKPGTMVMTDIQDNRRTELHYRNRDTDGTIPPETFTERQLRRGS